VNDTQLRNDKTTRQVHSDEVERMLLNFSCTESDNYSDCDDYWEVARQQNDVYVCSIYDAINDMINNFEEFISNVGRTSDAFNSGVIVVNSGATSLIDKGSHYGTLGYAIQFGEPDLRFDGMLKDMLKQRPPPRSTLRTSSHRF
jgi:hypothetical protein